MAFQRNLAVLVAIGCALCVVSGACSSSHHSSSSTTTTAPSLTTAAPTTASASQTTITGGTASPTTSTSLAISSKQAIGAPVNTASGTLVVNSLEFPAAASDPKTQPPAGTQFALVSVKSCAGPTAGRSAAPADFRLQLTDGRVVTPRVSIKDPAFVSQTLKPSACETGYVTFAVPTGGKPQVVVDTGSGASWTTP